MGEGNKPWRTDPVTKKQIKAATARALLEADRLTVVTLSDDGRRLIVRVIDSTDALATLKDLDDTEEILLYVGPSKEKLPAAIQEALAGK